ncbi:DNA polymerase III subunit alpha [Propionibacteriaceae bacterium G1746]|uniref:DNA polymerase III subunit alpha n=1 Tax=Aestuariimicrobium sp. G57 TaxID=3418485 RepID=UPI003C148C6D
MDQFVHLHCHTDFSMLDGAARVAQLTQAAAGQGMPAIAMTDHGNLYGAYEFYKAAKKAEIKPIIGLEAYLTPKTHRSERKRVQFGDGTGDDVASKGAYTHMTMWSANKTGMHNLFRLSSRSSLEGFFYKPRADRELLNEYSEGLIATTGCPSGEVQTYLRLGQFDNAVESAAEFRDIFGAGNFYVELMDHGLSIENRVRDDLLRLAKKLDLPLVATNDLHYVHKDDAHAHDTLLCVSAGARFDTPGRFKFDGSGYYLKSAEEMRLLFSNHLDACDNTLEIAERIETEFDEGMGTYMPKFPTPEGETEDSWFVKEVRAGLERRYPDGVPDEVTDRAKFEYEIILKMGFAGYFLVVADFINWAKQNGIRVGPGRGSGAGSMCAYALRITDLDPIAHGLLFERFLNPERVSMPDFDIDFDDRRRGEVIKYVTEKYGEDRVSQIITYGTIKAKQAVKDAARVLDKPYSVGDLITKAMPAAVMGKDVPLGDLFNPDHDRYAEGREFRELYESSAEVAEVVDTARGIEGLKRQWGVHAAGVIMSSAPLQDVIPVMKREQDGAIITQFDYPGCESLGLIKMDFLGLRNLTVLDDAVRNIKQNRDVDVVLEDLPLDDPATFDLLQRGDTLGVFQLDGGPMRALLRSMRPDKFDDISAVGALYRPGPMGADSHNKYARRKTGREDITPIHPELAEPLEDILGETYGLIVYQEQVMAIAQKLAGYTLGGADMLRRAMGKKKKKELDAQYEVFSSGMAARGYSHEAMQTVWDILLPFSDYAFNKSHSAAYGVVSYWTAYLKANYPVEYMAALLQSVKDDKDKLAGYLAECRHMGIQVLPPDVNQSQAMFTAVGQNIRFGLNGVRNVGIHVVEGIVSSREQQGPAATFSEFLDHVPLSVCNKRMMESLIKAGAFDEMGHTRRGLMEVYEQAIDEVLTIKKNQENGQDDLFADFAFAAELPANHHAVVPDMPEWEKQTKLAFEREMLGLYVSDHPLHGLEHVLAQHRDHSLGVVASSDGPPEGATVTICGMVTQLTRKQTKTGQVWAILNVEDLDGGVEVMVFNKVYEQVATQLATDVVVKVRGRVKRTEDDTVSIQANDLSVPEISDHHSGGPITIQLPITRCTPPVVEQLKGVLRQHPGVNEVRVTLLSTDRATTFRLHDELRVNATQPLMADLKALLGPSCLA